MLITDVLKEPEVWARMRSAFPGIEDDVGEIGAGLLHLEFAELRRRLELALDVPDTREASRILAFVDDLLAQAIHSDVENAIDVSFIEDLYLGEERWRLLVEPLLPAKVRAKWDESVAGHGGGRPG
jgi:hypothetical protein